MALLKSKQDPFLAFRLATYYAHIGNKDIVLAQLREMMERKPSFFEYVMKERDLAILHDTPEWAQWRKDVGLDEESLAAIEFEIPNYED